MALNKKNIESRIKRKSVMNLLETAKDQDGDTYV